MRTDPLAAISSSSLRENFDANPSGREYPWEANFMPPDLPSLMTYLSIDIIVFSFGRNPIIGFFPSINEKKSSNP
jgi:hypothetical protein